MIPPPNHDSDLIVVADLNKVFGLRFALSQISFGVARGTVAALLGPNGSGKTTLLRILSALSNPTSGQVTIGGWALPQEAAAVRAQLGVVTHLPLLYDDLTAEENLRFYAQLYGVEGQSAALLERVGLSRRARDLVRTFSRGMQQRLALARSMIHDPAIMLLDEPYTGLDTGGAALLDTLIREWRDAGRTVIIALHDLERAATLCDRALILRQGTLVADAAVATIANLPDLFTRLTA